MMEYFFGTLAVFSFVMTGMSIGARCIPCAALFLVSGILSWVWV